MKFYFYDGKLKLKTKADIKSNIVKKVRKNKNIKKGDLLSFPNKNWNKQVNYWQC